jgi:hypothetical protein
MVRLVRGVGSFGGQIQELPEGEDDIPGNIPDINA